MFLLILRVFFLASFNMLDHVSHSQFSVSSKETTQQYYEITKDETTEKKFEIYFSCDGKPWPS